MTWRVDFSDQTDKFLRKNNVSSDSISELIVKVLRKLQGENMNVAMGKLKGAWAGFYKIRSGRLRIIAAFNFDHKKVRVEVIDWRGSVYKK